MSEIIDSTKNSIGNCKYMKHAIFRKYICAHVLTDLLDTSIINNIIIIIIIIYIYIYIFKVQYPTCSIEVSKQVQYIMSIIVSNCQHCDEQQFQTLSCVHYNLPISSKARFIYTSTDSGLHSCPGKNYAYASRTSCYTNGTKGTMYRLKVFCDYKNISKLYITT